MSHHFIDLLEDLKIRLARMSAMVQQTVENAVEAVRNLDSSLALAVINGDDRIDGQEISVETAAINLMARYQPTAGDLRLIFGIVKVNNDFERIADGAVNIAQRVLTLHDAPGKGLPTDVRVLGDTVITTLRDTIKAFNLADETLAQKVLESDDVVDALYAQIVSEIIHQMENDSATAQPDFSYIMIAKNLERIADHCTNIAENVIYVNSGKIYRHRRAVS
jgi:phosphate transport system protein